MLYSLAEYKHREGERLFVFANWENEDDAALSVIAKEVTFRPLDSSPPRREEGPPRPSFQPTCFCYNRDWQRATGVLNQDCPRRPAQRRVRMRQFRIALVPRLRRIEAAPLMALAPLASAICAVASTFEQVQKTCPLCKTEFKTTAAMSGSQFAMRTDLKPLANLRPLIRFLFAPSASSFSTATTYPRRNWKSARRSCRTRPTRNIPSGPRTTSWAIISMKNWKRTTQPSGTFS